MPALAIILTGIVFVYCVPLHSLSPGKESGPHLEKEKTLLDGMKATSVI